MFKDLLALDTYMSGAIVELSRLITKGAKEAMNLIDKTNYQEVNEFMRKERIKMSPKRLEISKTLVNMYELQYEFIKKAGALGQKH